MRPWVRFPSIEENKTKQNKKRTVMILKASHGGTMPITPSMRKGKGRVSGKAKSVFFKNASHFIVFTKTVYSVGGVCSYYLYSTTRTLQEIPGAFQSCVDIITMDMAKL